MTTEIDQFIADLMTRNKALYGDLRMEGTESTPDEEKPVSDKPDASEEGSDKPADKGEEKAPEGIDSLPEWARKELSNVRAEAANYRTKLREAEAKLSAAKTPEEVEAAISELKDQNAKLERSILVNKVAGKHRLPAELAELLKGEDEAALEAHAKALAKFATPAPPTSLSGGLDPSDDDDGEIDPRKLAAKFRRY